MKPETIVKLNKFQPREYQLPILDAVENKGYKRVLAILPRRAGKDYAAWNLIIRQALKKVGVYWYVAPTYSQCRKIIWDSIDNTGNSFLSMIPPEIIERKNDQMMKLHLVNGSLIQLVGSDNFNSLVGSNPQGCVFTEYALQDPRAYQFIRPVLLLNNGWAVFLSTPRGKNHLWELWQIAQNSPDWFAYKMTVADTGHISLHDIARERASGEMSEDLIQQEYFCSFDMGVEGSYYSKYLDKMRLDGRIGVVPWEAAFKVNVSFDLGVRDSTCLIFYQCIGQTIRIIDCYENSKQGLEHYVKVIESKPYSYNRFMFPHDIKVQELGSGITRIEKLRQLGIRATVVDNIPVEDGIEAVRSAFSKIWIDEQNCRPLLKALENYRQEYDIRHKVYKSQPLHDWSSHFADCMRYLCISLSKTRDGLSAEELDKRYRQAYYGEQANMPSVFRDDIGY
jgi:hypothetical protein